MVLLDIDPSREYFLGLFHKQKLTPKVYYRSPSFETVRGFVASGMGYSILITQPNKNFDYSGNPIKIVKLSDKVEPGNITLTQLKNRRSSRLMQAFQEFSIKNFNNLN